jgi:hypothetical protein
MPLGGFECRPMCLKASDKRMLFGEQWEGRGMHGASHCFE